jgi:methylamine dehydrogenase accessory protein MauD
MIHNTMDILLLTARLLLAAVFIIAGLAKLADRAGSRQALINFGVPASLAAPFGLTLPVVELVIAVVLIPTASSWWGALGALLLLLLFIAAISANLAKGRKPVCHCFGQLDSAPIGWHTLVRNGVLAALAGLVLSEEWISSQLAEMGAPDTLVANLQGASPAAIGVILGVVVLVQGWLIYRLHSRVAAVETKLAEAGLAPSRTRLPVGIPAPAFHLTGLEGETITLDRLRSMGKAILLVFTNPACGPCIKLLPTLGRWQREHVSQLTIVNISQGSPEENRTNAEKYGLKNVLMQAGIEVQQAYQLAGTPGAVLVRLDGKIGSPAALGEDQIGALIRKTIHSHRKGQLLERAMRAVRLRLALNWSGRLTANG